MSDATISFNYIVELIEKGSWHVTDQYGSSAGLPHDVCERIARDICGYIGPEFLKAAAIMKRAQDLLLDELNRINLVMKDKPHVNAE